MGIRQQLDDDVKAAMLAGDSLRVDTLRGLKTAVLYADVATKTRDSGGIDDDAITALLFKEAKKRQESADLYVRGGSQERADKELAEKAIIETYLPKQLSDEELGALVDAAIQATGASEAKDMGKVIGAVKAKAGNSADGSAIARLVKERLAA
jgi:uncharacterized protein YqeY